MTPTVLEARQAVLRLVKFLERNGGDDFLHKFYLLILKSLDELQGRAAKENARIKEVSVEINAMLDERLNGSKSISGHQLQAIQQLSDCLELLEEIELGVSWIAVSFIRTNNYSGR